MNYVGKQLKALRESVGMTQEKMGVLLGVTQGTVVRYETGLTQTPMKILLWYADYFDVSMDYICGRTEYPQGKLYKYNPQALEADVQTKKFVEMCFEPGSAINAKLKEAVLSMLTEERTE